MVDAGRPRLFHAPSRNDKGHPVTSRNDAHGAGRRPLVVTNLIAAKAIAQPMPDRSAQCFGELRGGPRLSLPIGLPPVPSLRAEESRSGRWFRRRDETEPQGPHTDAQTCCTHGGTGAIAEFEIRKSRSPAITRHQRTRISSTRTAAMNASIDTARQPRSPRTSHRVTTDHPAGEEATSPVSS
jgi:hypothetical protein